MVGELARSNRMNARQIESCFNRCFMHSHHTRLCGGADEPLYLPATESQPAQLWFREDFAASALHEVAHWCIAGRARRRLTDFGYRYIPAPRTAQQQQDFFAAELKTQALEAIFADAAGVTFYPSADNLDACLETFRQALERQVGVSRHWLLTTRDRRAADFIQALQTNAVSGLCAHG